MVVQAPRITVRPERIRLGDLKLLEVNARYMRPETFRALVANVRRDGVLTQSPFAVLDDDGKYLVLSGNHRVRAAIEALGPDHVDTVLVTDDPLTREQRIAIQLSHNSISGEDDPSTLRALYEALDDIDWRAYSGLDDKTLDLLAPVEMPPLSEPNLTFQTITLTFLPGEVDAALTTWKEIRDAVIGDPVWLASMSEYDRAMQALEETGRAHGVTNTATALLLLLRMYDRHKGELADVIRANPPTKAVALSSILGTDMVSPKVAAALLSRLTQMRDSGTIAEPIDALAIWAQT